MKKLFLTMLLVSGVAHLNSIPSANHGQWKHKEKGSSDGYYVGGNYVAPGQSLYPSGNPCKKMRCPKGKIGRAIYGRYGEGSVVCQCVNDYRH